MTQFVAFWLSGPSAYMLGILSVMLAGFYLTWYVVSPSAMYLVGESTRTRLLVRAVNWGLFGTLFLFFQVLVALYGLDLWRAMARQSLFFLICSELGYHLAMLPTLIREVKRWRSGPLSSSH